MRQHYSRRFRFVMVDEYQDTNRPQYLLMRRFAEHHRNLTVVGDPDQSIYAWRGADIRNILDFEQDFPEAKVVRLERNYRSTQVILDAASAVIANNRNRKEKRLWTDRSGGDLIVYARCSDELEEGDFVAKTVRQVLAWRRRRRVGRALPHQRPVARARGRDAPRESGYRIIGGVRFYERKEIKDALAYLKLLLNPHDDVSLRRVINTPARGIGKGVLDAVDAASAGRTSTRCARVPSAGPLRQEPEGVAPVAVDDDRAGARGKTLLDPRGRIPGGVPRPDGVAGRDVPARAGSVAIAKMLDQSGYLQDLREERSEEAEGRVENLAELVSAAREYRGPRAGAIARRLCRSAVPALRGRRVRGRRGRAGAVDDACTRRKASSSRRSSSRASRRASSRTCARRTTTTTSRRSGASAMSA